MFDGAVALQLNFIADLSILVFDIGEKIVNTISCFVRSATIIATVILIAGHAAQGQQPNVGAGNSDAGAVAQGLRDVDIKMTNPDPDMRIGYLESIVAEGNARHIERAIRIAAAGQDEKLRALAFRAYLATIKSVTFDILLTPQEKRQIEEDRGGRRQLPRQLEHAKRVNYSLTLDFEPAPISSLRGYVNAGSTGRNRAGSTNRNRALEYTMRGERLNFSGYTYFGGTRDDCNWDLRPTKDLKILATLGCRSWDRPVDLVAPMF